MPHWARAAANREFPVGTRVGPHSALEATAPATRVRPSSTSHRVAMRLISGEVATGEAVSIFALERPVNLQQTLAHARTGSGDPCLRVIGDAVWRATRTPHGLATERLVAIPDGAIRVDAWGPGSEGLARRAPLGCGARADRRQFQSEP